MSAFEDDLARAIQLARREALLDHVRENPDVSLGELLGMGEGLGEVAAGLTVRELLTGEAGKRTGRAKARKSRGRAGAGRSAAATTAAKPRRRSKNVNTRTAEGREAFDQSVLEMLQAAGADGAKASAIASKCGGTPLQIRTALHRLKSSRRISRKGKARGTVWLAK